MRQHLAGAAAVVGFVVVAAFSSDFLFNPWAYGVPGTASPEGTWSAAARDPQERPATFVLALRRTGGFWEAWSEAGSGVEYRGAPLVGAARLCTPGEPGREYRVSGYGAGWPSGGARLRLEPVEATGPAGYRIGESLELLWEGGALAGEASWQLVTPAGETIHPQRRDMPGAPERMRKLLQQMPDLHPELQRRSPLRLQSGAAPAACRCRHSLREVSVLPFTHTPRGFPWTQLPSPCSCNGSAKAMATP